LGTWPKTAGIEEEKRRGKLFPKISLRCRVELKRQETGEKGWIVKCFKYRKEEHKYRECPEWKKGKKTRKERVAHVAMPQEAQQKEWRRSLAHILQWKVQEHYREGIPDKAYLLELGWYTKEIVVS